VPKWTVHEQTKGTYLEFIDDFEIAPGVKAEPHYHDTHEYYFIIEGNAVVQIEREARRVSPGDLVYIPPNAVHAIWPTGDETLRSFCFAVSYQEPSGIGYTVAELPEADLPIEEVDGR